MARVSFSRKRKNELVGLFSDCFVIYCCYLVFGLMDFNSASNFEENFDKTLPDVSICTTICLMHLCQYLKRRIVK